jgi:hypothetical protein
MADKRLPRFLKDWVVTDDTGDMLEIMGPTGKKLTVFKAGLDHLIQIAWWEPRESEGLPA